MTKYDKNWNKNNVGYMEAQSNRYILNEESPGIYSKQIF